MITAYREERSANGYAFDVLKSGVQKYIRRGQTEKALFCARDAALFREDPERGPGLFTNLLHRLLIIYMEDVANWCLLAEVDQRFRELHMPLHSPQDLSQDLDALVILLATSQKSRMVDHAKTVCNPRYAPYQPRYPDLQPLWDVVDAPLPATLPPLLAAFATALRSRDLRAVPLAFRIAAWDGTLAKPIRRSTKPVWFLFEQLAVYLPSKAAEIFERWYRDHLAHLPEGFLCWCFPLLYVLRRIPKGERPPPTEVVPVVPEEFKMDDFIIDKHTREGRSLYGYDTVEACRRFVEHGSVVENEAPWTDAQWKAFYNEVHGGR